MSLFSGILLLFLRVSKGKTVQIVNKIEDSVDKVQIRQPQMTRGECFCGTSHGNSWFEVSLLMKR